MEIHIEGKGQFSGKSANIICTNEGICSESDANSTPEEVRTYMEKYPEDGKKMINSLLADLIYLNNNSLASDEYIYSNSKHN